MQTSDKGLWFGELYYTKVLFYLQIPRLLHWTKTHSKQTWTKLKLEGGISVSFEPAW